MEERCERDWEKEKRGERERAKSGREVLPHVKEAGYNAIQIIEVVEHKDYFTVGYRVSHVIRLSPYLLWGLLHGQQGLNLVTGDNAPVTNFYAVSSRYGTPDDFKRLVDEAHGLGLLVFLEIVHSYAAADEMVGLSLFDGTNDCYFHTGIVFKRMFRSTSLPD
ncbi:hypothetical protein H5410_039051 [Solanum commersonii]|uniref:Uncharacterized protein n=1 Tax=Solanum commersonii TaxID=4109 RepID=A0A9J5YAS7_SOLCO|nr:hypothetical protein H5410_039051 [Solanum commersonii]